MRDVFDDINNAVLDLQQAQYQSFERPLKTLAKLLHSEGLETTNAKLIQGIDLDKFLEEHAAQRSGMLGGDSVDWPEDEREHLGTVLLLVDRFAAQPEFLMNFGHVFYHSDSKYISGIRSVVSQVIIPFARDYKRFAQSEGAAPKVFAGHSNEVFIVHGRAIGPLNAVARLLAEIGLQPVILNERASRSNTLIEKVEEHSNVGFAVVLLTADDMGHLVGEIEQPRARQNVILELGYFVGKLGRARVCALKQGEIEIPSDWTGIVGAEFDDKGNWKQVLGRELEAAGYKFDWNDVMRRDPA